MRETCLLCASKHISQAIVLVLEAGKGYPLHLWFAVGHLAEAEDESLFKFPVLANSIREVRIRLMGQTDKFNQLDLVSLLVNVRGISSGFNGYTEDYRTAEILAGRRLPENAEQTKLPV
jgi:hypothetical protein